MDDYVIYFKLMKYDVVKLREYVLSNKIVNTSGHLLSVNEVCYSIVKSWLESGDFVSEMK